MNVKKGDTIICKKEFTLANHTYLINKKYRIVGDVVIRGKRVITIKIIGEKPIGSMGLYNLYEDTMFEHFESKWDKRKRIIDEL